jgi:outer membrane protein OmpA-like peptidoglycan-associated protein
MKTWMIILPTVFVWACSSAPKVEKLPDSADAGEEIQKLEEARNEAQKNKVDVLAPKAWENSSYQFKRAQKRYSDHDRNSLVLDAVAISRAYLEQAKNTAGLAQGSIPDVVELREQAIEVQAPGYAKREWSSAENDFQTTTGQKEGRTTFSMSDQKRAQLRDAYIGARIAALQNKFLGEAKRKIDHAEREGAAKLVPHVYEGAVRTFKNTQGYISANRMDIAGIQKRVTLMNQEADKLERITMQAKNAKGKTPEEIALIYDKANLRNRALAAQLDDQAFQQKFEEARGMFDEESAEVYKDGDHLLIRLKGIAFPTARTELPVNSYGLITRAGTVIKNFGKPKVRIEGHTDSVGGLKVNQRLSEERAQAVADYLMANGGIDEEQIEVVGMAYSRPLASNKTADGRAQNRRVDVVVMPEIQEGSPQIRQAQ